MEVVEINSLTEPIETTVVDDNYRPVITTKRYLESLPQDEQDEILGRNDEEAEWYAYVN